MKEVEPSLPPLSPVLRQTLELLLTAKSEKEIAADLRISPHTLHSRIRVVYDRFGVKGRQELMAKLLRWPASDKNLKRLLK